VRAIDRIRSHTKRMIKIVPGAVNRCLRYVVFTFDLQATFSRRANYVYGDGDYVRNASLELAAREIEERGVPGAAAELGVFRGSYAKLINQAFPARTLYLFDTFEGFDPKEFHADREQGFIKKADDFTDTSAELVLRKMMYPQNCIVKKGMFPESSAGMEDMFAFVSIDCDLYQPTFAGLTFFWERLSKGGYIFVHDYQNPLYSGVRAAVRAFCGERGVAYTVMADMCGSAVVAKPL